MGSTNKTNNIALSQFVDTDKPSWRGDYSSDMLKIDGAFGAVETDIAAVNSTASSALSIATAANNTSTDVQTALGNIYTKPEVDSALSALSNASAAKYQPAGSAFTKAESDTRYEPFDSAYTKAEADGRFVRSPTSDAHAVFIGSSNSTTNTTWPQTLSNRLGVINHNYSIGGGGFTSNSSSRFDTQMQNAINDTSFDKSRVMYVFICDAGNDIRATNSVTAFVPTVLAMAKTAYPNARVIVIPALWGRDSANLIPGRVASITKRADEIRQACIAARCEMVEYSWTWHWDDAAWQLPGEVHYTPAGYSRIADFMERYVKTGEGDSPRGWEFAAPKPAVNSANARVKAKRDGNLITIEGTLEVTNPSGIALDVEIGQLPPGLGCGAYSVKIAVISNSDRLARSVEIYQSGLIRSFGTLSSGVHNFNSSYPAF